MGKRWIVLVNKSPRGPLSTDEIIALLAQNLIRRNDLAYEIPEDPSSGTAEWKFLWQFNDFDRRKDEVLPSNPAERTEAQRSRRAAPSERQLKAEVQAILPDEFASIQPEELVLKAKPNQKFESLDKDLDDKAQEEFLRPRDRNRPSNGPWIAITLIIGLAVSSAMIYQKKLNRTAVIEQRDSQMELPLNNRGLAEIEPPPPPPPPPPNGGSNSGGIITSVISREAPRPPEKGEVSLEDYRRQREERLEKERIEEEDRRKAELKAQEGEDEEEGGDEEVTLKPKKSKVKKRRPTSSELEEGIEKEAEAEPDSFSGE